MARGCPPHCGYNCQLSHHPLLIALLNTVPRDNNPISFTALEATISRYEKIGEWSKDQDIPDPVKEFRFPLILWAAALGMSEVVLWLKQHNFSPHLRHPQTGEGALHLAIKSFMDRTNINHTEPLEDFKKLVEYLPGALTFRDKEGNSPLHICAARIAVTDTKKKMHRDFAEAMLESAIENNDAIVATMLNSQNNDGDTVLHLLSRHDRAFLLAKYIIKLDKTDLNLKNSKKETALDIAVSNGAIQISSLLSTCLIKDEDEKLIFEDDYEPVKKLRRLHVQPPSTEPSLKQEAKTSPKGTYDDDSKTGKPVNAALLGSKMLFVLKDDASEIKKNLKNSVVKASLSRHLSHNNFSKKGTVGDASAATDPSQNKALLLLSRNVNLGDRKEKLSKVYFRSNFDEDSQSTTSSKPAKKFRIIRNKSTVKIDTHSKQKACEPITPSCPSKADGSSRLLDSASDKEDDWHSNLDEKSRSSDSTDDNLPGRKNSPNLDSPEFGDLVKHSGIIPPLASEELANMVLIPSSDGKEISLVRPSKNCLRITKLSTNACEKGISSNMETSSSTTDTITQSAGTKSVLVDSLQNKSEQELHSQSEVNDSKSSYADRRRERKSTPQTLEKSKTVITFPPSPHCSQISRDSTGVSRKLLSESSSNLSSKSSSNLSSNSSQSAVHGLSRVVTTTLQPVPCVIQTPQEHLVSSSSETHADAVRNVKTESQSFKLSPDLDGLKIEISDDEDDDHDDTADSEQFSEQKSSLTDEVDSSSAEDLNLSSSSVLESSTADEPLSPVISNVMSLAPKEAFLLNDEQEDVEEEKVLSSITDSSQLSQMSSYYNSPASSSTLSLPSPGSSAGLSQETRKLIKDSILRDLEKVSLEKKTHLLHQTRLKVTSEDLTEKITSKNLKVQQMLKDLDILQRQLLVFGDEKVRIESSRKAMNQVLDDLTAKEEAYRKALLEIGNVD